MDWYKPLAGACFKVGPVNVKAKNTIEGDQVG